jgi:D-serine deaminase-like pyridoxal phosphate-dependent protein
MSQLILSPEFKSLPPGAWGMSSDDFLATAPTLDEFQSPLLTLDRAALEHNERTMSAWLTERGLEIAPHGKTTMAPALWRRLLDAGAWGITLATAWQVQVARSVGISRVLLANELVDPVALRWLAAELADPDFGFACWVDSVDGVRAMAEGLAGAEVARPVDVIVELGGPGGRTGARSVAQGLEVASAVRASRSLRLVGVAGYEGSLGNDRSAQAIAAITAFLDAVVELARAIDWAGERPIVTAGGSAYFELVAERFAPLVGEATVVLRSGAYQVHDAGFYEGISPFAGAPGRFRSAMHGWARVVSRPEPGLALLDGGKRDFPIDLGMPVPQLVRGGTPIEGASIERLNDQHAYLRLADATELPLGSVLRLGLSHPCTAFDKWRLIPVIDDADAVNPTIVDLVRTYF